MIMHSPTSPRSLVAVMGVRAFFQLGQNAKSESVIRRIEHSPASPQAQGLSGVLETLLLESLFFMLRSVARLLHKAALRPRKFREGEKVIDIICRIGEPGRFRTGDPLIKSQMLYR